MAIQYLDFEIPWAAVPKGRPRFARIGAYVRTYTDAKTRAFEEYVATLALNAMRNADFSRIGDDGGCTAVTITANYVPPKSWTKKKLGLLAKFICLPMTKKPDIDNIAKSVLDGMNQVVFEDDHLVTDLTVKKVYTDKESVTIHVSHETIDELAGEHHD